MQACSRVFARVAILSFLSIAIAISTWQAGIRMTKRSYRAPQTWMAWHLHYLTAGQAVV